MAHRIHETGIFTYILVDFYGKCWYIDIQYMDPMGLFSTFLSLNNRPLMPSFGFRLRFLVLLAVNFRSRSVSVFWGAGEVFCFGTADEMKSKARTSHQTSPVF